MTDIVLITIESLRRDHFDTERFPECWDAFETDFAQFTDAYSNGVATPLSFPSIHTGHPVTGDGTLPAESPTIAESFPGHSWAVSNNPHLREERGYDQGFDEFTDQLDGASNGGGDIISKIKSVGSRSAFLEKIYRKFQMMDTNPISTSETTDAVLTELRSKIREKNGLFWVHLDDSHYPFTPWKIPDKDVEISYSVEEINEMNDRFLDGAPETEDIEFLIEMYDELISYIDRKLSDFFDFLKGIDRYDEAMILVMSDHGEGFGEEEVFNYTDGVYSHQWDADPIDSLVRVPLVVKYPNMEHGGACFTHPVQNGDLLATLADRFDWEVDVPELTQPFTEPESRTVVSKSNAALRVTTETGYVIQRQGDRKVIGEVGDDAFDVLEDATLPSVETVSGDIPGIDEREREQLEERLEYLGYK